jgi:hypothetical protein
MKESRDPPRLKLEAQGPLRDALSALENGRPGAESLARMSERLSLQFRTPPPPSGLAPLIKLGALVTITASVWLAWSSWQGSRSNMSAAPRPSAGTSTAAPRPSAGASTAPAHPAPAAPLPQPAAALERSGRVVAVPASAATRSAERAAAAANGSRFTQRQLRGPRGAERETPATPAPAADVAPEPSLDDAASFAGASGAPPTRDTLSLPRPSLDEAALLHKARALAASDPSGAMKLVIEHERNFPSGMLVQERELLAVELLRALSRGDEARARLQAFRARFPDSIYLQRARPAR